jgi:hypothetical protein
MAELEKFQRYCYISLYRYSVGCDFWNSLRSKNDQSRAERKIFVVLFANRQATAGESGGDRDPVLPRAAPRAKIGRMKSWCEPGPMNGAAAHTLATVVSAQ